MLLAPHAAALPTTRKTSRSARATVVFFFVGEASRPRRRPRRLHAPAGGAAGRRVGPELSASPDRGASGGGCAGAEEEERVKTGGPNRQGSAARES